MSDGRRLFEVLAAVEEQRRAAMPPEHRLVLVVLANRGAEIYPSLPLLSEMTGIPRATLIRVLNELEAARWISRTPGRGRTVTRYRVHIDGGPIDRSRPETSPAEQSHLETSQSETSAVPERDVSGPPVRPDPPPDPPIDPQLVLPAGARENTREDRPLAELGAADPTQDLIALARTLADEGSGIGRKVCDRAARGWRPTEPQLAALREIAAERAQLASGSRSPPRGAERSTLQKPPQGGPSWSVGEVG